MSIDNETVLASVIVHCEEKSHEDRRYIVFRFDLILAGDRRIWASGDVRGLAGSKKVMGRLDGSRYLTGDDRRAEDIRLRVELECGICGMKGVYRYDNLTPVLDRLAEAGVMDVSLRGLAAIVSS